MRDIKLIEEVYGTALEYVKNNNLHSEWITFLEWSRKKQISNALEENALEIIKDAKKEK